jgi:hypothetical protein
LRLPNTLLPLVLVTHEIERTLLRLRVCKCTDRYRRKRSGS